MSLARVFSSFLPRGELMRREEREKIRIVVESSTFSFSPFDSLLLFLLRPNLLIRLSNKAVARRPQSSFRPSGKEEEEKAEALYLSSFIRVDG